MSPGRGEVGMKFVLASQNVHKQRELQAVLAPYGVELLLQRDLGVPIDVAWVSTQ